MAKWNVESSSTLQGVLDKNDTSWKLYQDEKPFLEQAKIERETHNKHGVGGFRKFASIPDIVAIEILHKYGLDIHDPEFMHDTDKIKRLKYIVQTEYAHLLSF